jgi:type I restriction enzyme S subunit
LEHDRPCCLDWSPRCPLGNVQVALGKAWVSEHALRCFPEKPLDVSFFRYALQSLKLGQYSVSAAQPGLSPDNLKPLLVPFPSLDIQKRIASFLDEKTDQIDALIEKKRELLDRLAEKRQATITHAVTKGLNPSAPMKDSGVEWLGSIPAHWKVIRLKYLVRDVLGQMGPFGGMLTDLSPEPTGFKLYGQENTISGNFQLGNRWVEEERFNDLARYQLRPGDLVITRKGSLGSCRRFPGDAIPGLADSDTIIVRFDEKKLQSALAIILLHDAAYVAAQIESTRRGAILAGLNSTVVGDLWLVCPSSDEQSAITKWCGRFITEIDTLVEAIEKSIKQTNEYRSTLITSAVTGQIEELR